MPLIKPQKVWPVNRTWFRRSVTVAGVKITSSKEVLAQNLEALMLSKWGEVNQNKAHREIGVSQSTIGRILKKTVACEIDTLDAIAKYFKLEPWQLLLPNLDPKNPIHVDKSIQEQVIKLLSQMTRPAS